jgi:predicted negative regulator of RcsB-dependent stress response
MYWQEGVGDVLAELGEIKDAEQAYEAAIAAAPGEALKKPLQAKLDKLRTGKK